MAIVNGVELARMAGCTKSGVSRALKRGAIVKTQDGKYDTENRAVKFWLHDSTAKKGAGAVAGAMRATEEPAAPEKPRADSYFLILADLGEGFRPIIQYNFTPADDQASDIVFPVPFAVRVDLEEIAGRGEVWTVRNVEDGREYSTKTEVCGNGLDLERRFWA